MRAPMAMGSQARRALTRQPRFSPRVMRHQAIVAVRAAGAVMERHPEAHRVAAHGGEGCAEQGLMLGKERVEICVLRDALERDMRDCPVAKTTRDTSRLVFEPEEFVLGGE